jgi:trigger factor
LEVNVEKAGACQATVSFTVPAEEFDGAVQRALKNAGQNVRMKGFRAGKIPPQVLERAHGDRIRQEAIEHFLRQAYEKAVTENDLKIVGFERVNLSEVKREDGTPFNHAFEVSLRPEITLGEYKGTTVESELAPVMDEEVSSAIEELRRNQARPEPAEGEGVPEDGMAVCSLQWLFQDEVVFEREGLRLSPSAPIPGVDPEILKSTLSGTKAGETVDMEMTFPPDFEKEEARGQVGNCKVTVDEAFTMVMPTDDELKQLLEAGDAELSDVVKERIGQAKESQEQGRIEGAIIDKLVEAHPMELPERMLEEQTKARLAQARKELGEQGLAEEQIEEQVSGQEDKVREVAAKGMRALFLIQAIAEKEELLVDNDDMKAELEEIASRNNSTLEEVANYYRENNLFDQMAIEILERKVRLFLRESAQVTQPS